MEWIYGLFFKMKEIYQEKLKASFVSKIAAEIK